MPHRRLDATALHDWAHTAVGDLLRHADEINRLNVFPVADSDTGTNMLFTMRPRWSRRNAAADAGPPRCRGSAPRHWRGAQPDGARGNSGVILAQILRGLADVMAEAKADTDLADSDLADIDPALLAAALRHAVVLVVSAMGGEVVDGTVVSVLQAAAEAVGQVRRRGRRSGPRCSPVPAKPPRSHWSAHPINSRCWPRPAWWTPAGADCWCCSMRSARPSPARAAPSRPYQPGPADGGRAVTEAGAPQFEVMYLVSDCDSGRRGPSARRTGAVGRFGGAGAVGGRALLGARAYR